MATVSRGENLAAQTVEWARPVEHDYHNDGSAAARILNVFIPGGFEVEMPKIVEWFAAQPVS